MQSGKTASPRSFLTVIAGAYALNLVGRVADVGWLLLLFTALPVEQIANFALASAVAAFFAMSLDAGLNQTLLREFSSRRLTLQRGARIAATTRAALLMGALTIGALWIVFAKPAADLVAVIAAACSVQLWIVIEQFCQQWLKANDRQTLANALAASEPFLKLSAAAVLVIMDDGVIALEFFAVQNVYHCLLTAACVIACVRNRGPAPSNVVAQPLPVMLRASAWFALMGLITVTQNRVDWLLLSNFASQAAVATYSLVGRAYEVLMMLIGTGAMTLFPLLCRDRERQQGLPVFRKAVLATGVAAAGAAAMLLPGICEWIWMGKYPGANTLFALLMPVACLSTFIQMMYYEAIASRAEGKLVALGVVSTLAQLVVNAVLVPRWGPVGAVAGLLTLASANIALYFVQRVRLGLPPLAVMVPLAAYAVGMAIVATALSFVVPNVWARLGIGFVVWALFTYGWLLDSGEKAALKGILGSMRLRLVSVGGAR